MSSNGNQKFNVAGDRPLGAAKPVDPATRLSELLAQSLEELTRPFDPPRAPPRAEPPLRAVVPPPPPAPSAVPDPAPALHAEPEPHPPVESRVDADRALAELEAELFANRSHRDAAPSVEPPGETHLDDHPVDADAPPVEPVAGHAAVDLDAVKPDVEAPPPVVPAPAVEPTPASEAEAARIISRVRRLMMISMAVTIIAVGSVFGFIGYRVFKGEGSIAAKTADKVAPSPNGGNEMTLALPRGARILQSAVAEDRLIITLQVNGRTEVRTFDLKTLQPAGRLTFSATP